MKYILVIISYSLLLCSHVRAQYYENRISKSTIKTVQIYNNLGDERSILNPAVTSLFQNDSIRLEFDELGNDAQYYYAKIIHCDVDWTKSDLADPEFMTQYNEFLIQDYDFSFNTKIPYTHYKFNIPPVKLSGNYVVVVYSEDNPENYLITRRFMIVETLVRIKPYFSMSELVGMRETHQQVAFEVFYDQFEINIPSTEIKATIRQNYRWDNAKYNLKPLYFDEGQKILDFRYFDDNINFPGWNEFRNFAFRNVNFEDQNVAKIDIPNQTLLINLETSRLPKSYVNYIDINGNYVIENNIGNKDLASDYFHCLFRFKSEPVKGKYYVTGKLSNWENKLENQFTYDSVSGHYIADMTLKQGYYDYLIQYKPEGKEDMPTWLAEGSHFQTQNDYEIIIYHRPIGGRFDRIIGYLRKEFFN